MVADAQGTPPAGGWFPDPAGSPYLRWWDGAAWTDHFIDATTGAPPRELPVAPAAAPQQEAVEPAVAESPASVEPQPVAVEPAVTAPATADVPTPSTPAASVPAVDPVTPAFIEPEVPAAAAAASETPWSLPSTTSASAPASSTATEGAPLTRRQLREQEERQSLENFSPAVAAPDPAPLVQEPAAPEPVAPEPTPFSFDPTPAAAPVAPEATPFVFDPAPAAPPEPEPTSFVFDPTPAAAPETSTPAAVDPGDPFGGTMPPPAMPAAAQPAEQTPADALFPFETEAQNKPSFPFETTAQPSQPIPAQPSQPIPAQPSQPIPAQSTPAQSTPSQPVPTQPVADDAPTSWPFVTGFDAASTPSAFPAAEAPFAPNSAGATANTWLGAPPPQPSDAYALPGEPAAAGSAAAVSEPMTRGRQRQSAERVEADDRPGSSTWAVWVFAALPILHFVLIYVTYVVLKPADDTFRFAVLLGPIVIYLALAAVDRSVLARSGYETLPSPLLAIIPPLYLGFRVTRVGRSSLPQLITWFVLQAVVVAVLIFVFPTQFSQLTSGTTAAAATPVTKTPSSTTITAAERATELTPTGMQDALKKQFLTQGISLTSVTCPALANTDDATQVTCNGTMASGALDIVVAVDSKLKTSAFDIVSSTPPSN